MERGVFLEVDRLKVVDVSDLHIRLDVEGIPRDIGSMTAAVDPAEAVSGGHGVFPVAKVHCVVGGLPCSRGHKAAIDAVYAAARDGDGIADDAAAGTIARLEKARRTCA